MGVSLALGVTVFRKFPVIKNEEAGFAALSPALIESFSHPVSFMPSPALEPA
jgi:hypothetical protein